MADKLQSLEREKSELNTLLRRGFTFEVQEDVVEKGKKLTTNTRIFTIQEPTLDVLDRISAESLELAISEEKLKSEGLNAAKRLAVLHAKRCAKIVAIAALGQAYWKRSIDRYGTMQKEANEAELNRLTTLFYEKLKPSDLLSIVQLINAMSNFGDFIASIRLISANRTAKPALIEEEQQA